MLLETIFVPVETSPESEKLKSRINRRLPRNVEFLFSIVLKTKYIFPFKVFIKILNINTSLNNNNNNNILVYYTMRINSFYYNQSNPCVFVSTD